MKACTKCGVMKPLDQYHRRSDAPAGRVSACKPCRAIVNRTSKLARFEKVCASQRRWREANKEHLTQRGARRLLEKRAMTLAAAARIRARRKKIPFDLDQHIEALQARIDIGRCELTGVAFDLSPGRTFASPSFDRRIPALGYAYTNIRVVCHGINAALGDWGDDALLAMLGGFLRHAIDAEAAANFIASYMAAAPDRLAA